MSSASKNFDWDELACKCGCGTQYVSDKAIIALQEVREVMGVPLHINSAARCLLHNQAVGGAKGSKHLSYRISLNDKIVESTAFDISTSGIDAARLVQAARRAGFNGIGIAKTFIHVDIREEPASWTYP